MSTIEERVKKIVAEQLGVKEEERPRMEGAEPEAGRATTRCQAWAKPTVWRDRVHGGARQ